VAVIFFHTRLSYSQKLIVLLGFFTIFRLIYALLLPLSPQETYYWVYSLHPALSYFDHPPGAAYSIWLLAKLLGPTTLAIRLGPLLYFFGFSWILYWTARRLADERTGFWVVLLINLLPTFSITALIMTPDCPLLFFWILCCWSFIKAVQENRYSYYLWAGIGLGLALLSKYTAVFLPVSMFLFLAFSPFFRPHLKRVEPYGGIVLALLIFSPVLVWNFQNHWASFAFQSTERAGGMTAFRLEEFVAFLASQAGILTPLVFAGLCWTIGLGIKRFWKFPVWQEAMLLSLSLPMIALFTLVATLEWVKINWLIPVYPPLLLLMIIFYQNRAFAGQWIYSGLARWTWITALICFIVFHLWPIMPWIPVSGSTDTLTGWQEMAAHLEKIQKTMPGSKPPFIFAWGHKTASELQFYLKGQPETFTQTVLGEKCLAYDYWFNPAPLQGRDAIFVWSEFDRFPVEKVGLLDKYFTRVEPLTPVTVYRGDKPLRTFYFFHCYGYKGIEQRRPSNKIL
jgi:4-amino-4-deoxy-L-arabinose transferase-like glycosyltransferase